MQNPDTDQPRETIATGEQPRTSTINDRRDSLAALRKVQSDPEDKKAKARSRFTSAIRKLSHSGRKKKKLPATATTSIECNEPVLSSGTEELSDLQEPSITDSDQKATKLPTKKKSKLTKNIFGLKKSKVGDKSSREAAEKGKKLKEERESNQNLSLQQAEKEQFRTKPEQSTNKFQFTISAKKIESKVKRQLAETDYLTLYADIEATTTDSSSTPKTAHSTDPNSALKKKKLKGKGNQQLSPQSTQRKSSVERSIITQSLRDISPKEKAPTKPSRLHSNCALQTTEVPTNQGAIRKTTTTTRAAVRLVSAAKPKQPKSATTTISGIKKSPPISPSGTRKGIHLTAARNTAATTKETDLMRNLQRGHLLPKPTVTVIAINNNNNNNENNNNNRCNKQELSNVTKGEKEEHLEFPTVVKQQIQVFQPQQQLTAIAVNTEEQPQSLLPPDYPPPPPPRPLPALLCDSGYPTPEIRSTAAIATTTTTTTHQSYTSLSSTPGSTGSGILSKQKQRFLLGDINSVTSAQTNTTDDHISLTESAQHSIRRQESLPLTTTLHFALGSPVRPPPPQQQQQQRVQTWSYTTENKFTPSDSNSFDKRERSGDSQRGDGADIRRRIHYVSQPTLYDDIDSLDLNRNYKYRYHSGISDLSLDSVADNVTLGDEEDEDREAYQSMPGFGDLTMDQDMEPTVMTSISTEKREHLYKILVIGELGTGKTSFIKRYVHQFFSQNYRATIGVDFALKVLHWDSNTVVRLQLWDIAGQERFGNMTRVYYKEAVGAFIVFDVTRSGTFDCVSKWKEDLDSKVQLPDGSPIPCILLANKCDQEKQGLVANADKIEEYVKENGFSGWFETSAKENINIDEAARALVSKILLNDKLISAADLVDGEKFNLNNTGDQSAYEEKSKCSC